MIDSRGRAWRWIGPLVALSCGDSSGPDSDTAASASTSSTSSTAGTSTASTGASTDASTSDATSTTSTTSTSAATESGTTGDPGLVKLSVPVDGGVLTQDADALFLGTDGGILRVDKATLEVTELYNDRPCGEVAVGGDFVYGGCTDLLADPPRVIVRVPRDGGPATELVGTDIINHRAIVADASALYYYISPDLLRIGVDEVTPTVVASHPINLPDEAAVDDASYYVTYAGDVFAFPLAGGEVVTLVDSDPVKSRQVRQNSTHVYTLTGGATIVRTAKDGSATAPVEGATNTLADAVFAVDDAELFFVEGYTLRRVAAGGGAPTDAGVFDVNGSLYVTGMEVDDDAVWILAGGLYRLAR